MQQAEEIWASVKAILIDKGCLDEMQLLPGASEQQLDDLEGHLGVALPELLRHMLLIHDGQAGCGLLFGTEMLSIDGIRQAWDGWRDIDETDMNADCAEFMASRPPGAIKPLYTNPGWIPLTHDAGGNHMGLDFDPDQHGTAGQLIVFGRDEATKILITLRVHEFMMLAVAWLKEARWDGEILENPADGGYALPALFGNAAT